jgi:hypothetical protein
VSEKRLDNRCHGLAVIDILVASAVCHVSQEGVKNNAEEAAGLLFLQKMASMPLCR